MAGAPVRLLIADSEPREGEPSVGDLMAEPLRFVGFDVVIVAGGRDALRIAEREGADLVLLDIDLPDLDGFTVVHRLQTLAHPVPALCITARDDVEDKVRALDVGADDYVTKPFSVEEVFARIRAVLRRTRDPKPARISVADLVLDDDTHDVWRAGERVSLSATEFRLLRYLMVNSGRAQSKQQIFDHVWPPDSGCGFGVVESYVSYVRRKVDRGEPRLIYTLRGVGYMLRGPGR
jgi:two-component system OmpR family response regulator